MTATVPGLSIAGMMFTLCLVLGIPIAALIVWAVKKKAKFSSALIGAAAFIVFALILEQILHAIMQAAFGEKLTANIWVYALYGGLAAGLFEETARLLSMKFLMKKTLSKENAIMYGIGHGGVEAILLIGLTYVSNIMNSVMINLGLLEKSLDVLDEATKTEAIRQLSALWTTPSSHFFLAGIERVCAFILQISLSYIVYRAVKDKKAIYWCLAFLIHFLVDAVTAVLASKTSILVTEAVLVGMIIVIAGFTYRQYKSEK